jgi:hypothetical protein
VAETFKLSLEDLKVESFETTPAPVGADGTILGQSGNPDECSGGCTDSAEIFGCCCPNTSLSGMTLCYGTCQTDCQQATCWDSTCQCAGTGMSDCNNCSANPCGHAACTETGCTDTCTDDISCTL